MSKMIVGEGTYGTIATEGRGTVTVGKYCSLAPGIKALFLDGHRADWISTYPFPTKWKLAIPGDRTRAKNIEIGNDVWIGRDVTLLEGCKIHDGAIVGSCSVVAGTIPPYNIAVGNPAKSIKQRFSDEHIRQLLEMKWWDWPVEMIRKNVELLCSTDIERFVWYADPN